MSKVLNFQYGSVPKQQNWFGLESGGLCLWSAGYRDFFNSSYDATLDETNVCKIDVPYTNCQNWYKAQSAN
jgi:hypothetical protein